MFPQLLDSTEAYDIAKAMRDGFNRHYRLFRTESARAMIAAGIVNPYAAAASRSTIIIRRREA